MSVRIQQLNELTGLDEETIKEQILPYLATFPAKQALINHLQDLLGPGVKQNSFIQSYSDERFPPSSEATSTSNNNTLDSKSTASIPAKASGTRRAKTKFPSKLPPPRKVHASSFSREGAVYRKGQDDELLFGPSSSSKAGPSENLLSNAMPSISHFATPSASRPQTPNQANVPEESKATTGQNSSTAHILSPKAPREDEFVLVPTEEMKNIQQSIALLRGDSKDDPSIKAKPCFCQGRRHALHPLIPLCMTCGLVLCSILSPSPLLLPSPPCPSCATPLLSITSRAILLTQLEMKLESLTESHKQKVELIREERRRAWKEKRQEVELFPELQQHQIKSSTINQSAGSNKEQVYNQFHERRRNMDIAMGRRVEDDNLRKARVLRIESKAGKGRGTVIKKKKREQGVGNNVRKDLLIADSSPMYSEASGREDDDEEMVMEMEEEEPVLDYDDDDDDGNAGNGPVADVEDDGFARHATSFPPNSLDKVAKSLEWDTKMFSVPNINYIAEKDRTKDAFDYDAVDEDTVPANRFIPGAAPKGPIEKKGKKAVERE